MKFCLKKIISGQSVVEEAELYKTPRPIDVRMEKDQQVFSKLLSELNGYRITDVTVADRGKTGERDGKSKLRYSVCKTDFIITTHWKWIVWVVLWRKFGLKGGLKMHRAIKTGLFMDIWMVRRGILKN